MEKIGQRVYRLGIFKDQQLIGIALGTLIKAKRGTYIHFRHGPVIDWSNSELVEFVYKELKTLAKLEKAWFVRVSPLITTEQFKTSSLFGLKSTPSQMHDVDSEETWILDLDKSEDELLTNMRKNTRYMIRKAEKMGIKILMTNDPKYLSAFWLIMQDTVKRQQWTFYSFDYIKGELETFAKDNQSVLLLAQYEGKFIAGSMFNFYNGQSVYRHSGTLTEFRKIPASYLIQWEAIKEAKRRGLSRYNFWGLPLSEKGELKMNDPWTGVGLFKVGFGGRPEIWIHARDIPVSAKYKLTHYFEKFETKKRALTKKSN
jgi:lipid II:glycine glycyltransferase (peptidoglycan interpeptide bridge formation enzyme)